MSAIKLTENYVTTLKSFINFIKSKPTQEVLFFKHGEHVYLSRMDSTSSCWVNIKTKPDNIDFELKEIGVINIDDFLRYLSNVKYPKDSSSSVVYKIAKSSSSGTEMPMFQILGRGTKFFLPVANTDCFTDDYDRKVPVDREKDPIRLVSKFTLKASDISSLKENIKLMDLPKVFGLSILNDSINIYAKGTANQQFEKTIDKLCTKVFGGYSTSLGPDDPIGCKLFPTEFLSCIEYFDIDFDIDIRLLEPQNAPPMMIIKAYGVIDNSKNGGSNIEILVATHESQSESVTGVYEVMS